MTDLPIIRFTRPDETHLFTYSYSIVENILTCPVYGLIRYYKRKYWPTGRVLPLEAGSTMHDVFAAVRLWQLYRRQNLPAHFDFHARRIFGDDRVKASWKTISHPRDELLHWCFKILNSADYYDDPNDRIRTIANMEETTIRYVDEQLDVMDHQPIWVKDPSDPTGPVGIELYIDTIVEWQGQKLRYICTLDGITAPTSTPGVLRLDENKTASRLDQAFRQAYMVKSQPTGYIAIGRIFTGLPMKEVRMIGIKLKQTRSNEDYYSFIEEREDYQIMDWAKSLFFCKEIVERYGETPIEAPQFTHSCNRYFRACSFVELCAAPPDDRLDMFENSMVEAPLTPSQEAILARSP